MRPLVLMIALGACGRSGFEDSVDAAARPDAGSIDPDAVLDPFDAPPGSIVVIFGETPAADVQSVTSDTYLSSESSSYNYGASTRLSLEGSQKRALLRFDVSSLPAGTQVFSARLHVRTSSLESTTTMSMAPVLEAWTEGTQSGGAGVANFTQRTATQGWATAGAGSPSSAGSSIATAQLDAIGPVGLDLPPSVVQGWIDAPATNFGVVMSGSGGDVSISSSNEPTASDRPELVITYFP